MQIENTGPRWSQFRLVTTRDEAAVVYFSLLQYRDVLMHDLATKYHNNPRWSKEDEEFLSLMLSRVNNVIAGYDAEYRHILQVPVSAPAPEVTCCYNRRKPL